MTMRRIDVNVVVEATFYGVEIDIPDEYESDEAVTEWLKTHHSKVDAANVGHTETLGVLGVLGIAR